MLPAEFQPRTVPALLAERALCRPESTAVIGLIGGRYRVLRLSELDTLSSRLAAGLLAGGLVEPGAAVAWSLGNDRGGEAFVLYHAVLKAGGVNVPVNPKLSRMECEHLVTHSGARTVIIGGDAEHPAALPGTVRQVVADDAGEWIEELSADRPVEPVPVAEDDLAVILYTSGTTGLPKGVEHTHASALAAGIGWADCFRLTADDVVHSPFPVFSGAGLHFNGLAALWSGAAFLVDQPDVAETLARVARFRSTVYVAVPSVYQYWLDHGGFDTYDLTSLRILDFGGANMAPAVIGRLREALPGVGLMQTYGFTEAGPGGTYLPEEYLATRPGSIGNRAAGRFTRFRVVDEDGKDVGPEQVGEFVLSGPSVMRGYHNDPDATAAVMSDGWLRSGDLVRYDQEGFLHYVDRKRDLIVRGGYNIAPVEIEEALLSHPAVLEAGAYAVGHPALGEEPAAAVVLRPGSAVSREELRTHCRALLAEFKVPKAVSVVESLPKNAAGKTLRRVLRATLGAGVSNEEST